MLDIVRANTKSIFTWIIVLGIAFIFAVNFGPGSLSKGEGSGCGAQASWAARVNGKPIPASLWERQYSQTMRLYQQQAGESFSKELAEQLGLGKQVLTSLVDTELTLQEAKRRGVLVTDAEISKAVHAMPAFQENGQFKYDLYLEAVRGAYGGPQRFEEAVRDNLTYQKMMDALASTVKVPEAEVREAWRAGADRAALTFVQFPVNAAREEVRQISDADLAAFQQKEGARIEKFYAENQARYDQKQKVRVREILAATGPSQDDAAARKKIEAAQARVKKGDDFAAVARELSDDPNAKTSGGDMGFVAEGLVDEAFAKAAFALQKGQVSEPVKTPTGYHLLKAEDVIPAKKIPLDQARADIARELLQKDRAEKLVRDRAEAALAAARKGQALTSLFPTEEAAKKGKAKVVKIGSAVVAAAETGPFSVTVPFVPRLGQAPELGKAAAAAKAGDVLPRVFDTPAGPVVAVVTKRDVPVEADFQKERPALQDRLEMQRTEEARRAWLAGLREKATVEENHALVAAGSDRAAPEG